MSFSNEKVANDNFEVFQHLIVPIAQINSRQINSTASKVASNDIRGTETQVSA